MKNKAPLLPASKVARPLLHLPEADWPQADRLRFAKAFAQPHDIFADDGGGNHLKPRTKNAIRYGYRRWLGWVASCHPSLLTTDPGSRATPSLIRSFVTASGRPAANAPSPTRSACSTMPCATCIRRSTGPGSGDQGASRARHPEDRAQADPDDVAELCRRQPRQLDTD